MPLSTIFTIFVGVIVASALTIWLIFAVMPAGAASWALPMLLVVALVARLVIARRMS